MNLQTFPRQDLAYVYNVICNSLQRSKQSKQYGFVYFSGLVAFLELLKIGEK